MSFYWEEVQKLAKAHHIQDPLDDTESFERFLKFWWCQKYNRPMKDPLLLTYTSEELAYEWLRYVYLQPENDPKKQLEKVIDTEEEDEWIKAQMGKLKQNAVVKDATNPARTDVKASEPETPDIPELPDISTKF